MQTILVQNHPFEIGDVKFVAKEFIGITGREVTSDHVHQFIGPRVMEKADQCRRRN